MSLPRYPEYRDSGVEWMSDVPAHWEVKPIKALATLNDETLPESTDPEYEIEYADISSVSLYEGIESTETMVFGAAPSRARRMVRDGDVLVSTVRTYLKAIAPVVAPPRNLIASTGFAVVRPKPGQCSGFLKYGLQSESFVHQVIARSTGVSYPAINPSDLARISLWSPPLPEQQAIAAFLNRETAKIDALIAEQEKLLALLAEKRQATISHAVTRGLDPNAPMKNSGIPWLGEVPAHWDLVPCRFLVSERDERNEGAANQDYLSLMANVGVIPYADKGDIGNKKPEDLSKCKLVEVGDLVINSMNYGIGSYGLSPLSGVCSPVYIVLAVKQSTALREFVYRIFQNRGFQLFAQSFGNGILAHRAAIGWDTLKGLQVVLPSLDEQREIVEYVKSVEDTERQMRIEGERAIALLKERRSALIAAAVNGRIDVRGAVDPEAA